MIGELTLGEKENLRRNGIGDKKMFKKKNFLRTCAQAIRTCEQGIPVYKYDVCFFFNLYSSYS